MKQVVVFSRIFRWDNKVLSSINSVMCQTYRNFKYYIEVNDQTYEKLKCLEKSHAELELIKYKDGEDFGFRKNVHAIIKGADFVCDFDGDDVLALDFLETQINFMEQNNLDISCCSVDFMNSKGEKIGEMRFSNEDIVIDQNEFINYFNYYFKFMRSIWGKVFRTSLFTEEIWDTFPKSETYGGYGGDTKTSLELLKKAHKIGIHPKIGYYYTIWQQSGSYKFTKGREFADVFLLNTIVDFHRFYLEKIPFKNYEFICRVYLNGLINTVNLISYVKMTDMQKVEKLSILLNNLETKAIISFIRKFISFEQKELSVLKKVYNGFILNMCKGAENIVYEQDYYEIFRMFYPKYRHLSDSVINIIFENLELFRILTNEDENFNVEKNLFMTWKNNPSSNCIFLKMFSIINENLIFKYTVNNAPNKSFLINNKDLLEKIAINDSCGIIDIVSKKISSDSEDSLFLIEILINLSVDIQSQDLFIQSHVIKANLLKSRGDEIEYIKVQEDLLEMGVTLEE